MHKIRNIFLFVVIFTWCTISLPPHYISGAAAPEKPRMGVWVTVFSPEKILYSRENADRFISSCKEFGIDHAYVQVYRSGKPYYGTEAAKGDVFKYLLSQARKKGLKIYAWVNLLSIAQNNDAFILKTLGDGILVKDQYGRTPLRKGGKDELDKYYIRENQLFLEPGNKRVRKYLSGVVETLLKKYPELDGLHLDYVRYPSVVPFVPGSRFTPPGISYGYEKRNIENFKKETGLNIETMEHSRENSRAWDDWRRNQVTALVGEVSARARALSPSIKISCTILPSIERTYMVSFQDWTRWLREKYVDWVVIMNYTEDTELMKLNSLSMLLPQFEEKVYIGVGAFLLKDKPEAFQEQLRFLRETAPGGIVLFSYDDIKDLPLSEAGS
ncbi:MAG: family 10 glycosylhydrolase [Candidatus Omnitrophota bacterium]